MVVNKFNRRDFLKMAAVVSAGLSTTGTSLFNLRNLGTFAATG
ncbi:MAG: twin-arginine translocation signal domain-containing protein, partial [Saprospiraceae bacterium]|nr:twin-arginine translocation signal domain-containing protein [Saprospiraceae bacterium]